MNAAESRNTEVLTERIQSMRDDIVDGAPVTFAFRARNRLVLSERIILACWVVLGAAVFPSVLFAFTSLDVLPVVLLSPVSAQLLTAIAGRGSTRALGLANDGSVIVARLGWSSNKVRGIEKIYQSPALIIEPATPGWRTQRVFVDGHVWFHCNRSTHFVQRPAADRAATYSKS